MTDKIYIVLSHSGTIVSKAIQKYTHKPYSHVSISLDRKLDKMYSFGRIYKYTPLPGGFVEENFSRGVYTRFDDLDYSVYELEITREQKNKLIENLSQFKSNKYGYNVIGLLTSSVQVPIERENSYFCSQFVAHLLKESGIHIVNKPPGLTGPMDFIENDQVRLIYRREYGQIQECR